MKKTRRLALDEPARLHPNEWSSIEAKLLECTDKGFRALCDASLRVGARVMLEIPKLGAQAAYVTWRRGSEIAATFEEPLDLARAGFLSINREAVLARLLSERAEAHASGRVADEYSLRLRILNCLPVRSGDAAR